MSSHEEGPIVDALAFAEMTRSLEDAIIWIDVPFGPSDPLSTSSGVVGSSEAAVGR